MAAGGTAQEEVNLLNPAAGDDTVVQGWEVAGTTPFKLYAWLLGSDSGGNMSVTAPATATTGGSGTITLSFSGLTSGMKDRGSVVYGGTTGMPIPTIVRVDFP